MLNPSAVILSEAKNLCISAQGKLCEASRHWGNQATAEILRRPGKQGLLRMTDKNRSVKVRTLRYKGLIKGCILLSLGVPHAMAVNA